MRTCVISAALLVLFAASSLGAQEIKTRVATDFTLPDMDGNRVTLSELFGKGPIYISFWATWCKPCREELKIIQGLYEKYGARGFQVLALNTEGPRALGKIKSYVKSNGWTFRILIDNDGEVFRRKYKGFAQPYSFLTDPQGQILFSSVGFKPGDETRIEELILKNLPSTEKNESAGGSGE